VSFQLPNFNLTCGIYTSATNTLRLTSTCNLAWGRRVQVATTGGTGETGVPLACLVLLLPPLTDIRTPTPAADPYSGAPTIVDYVEVPLGSGRMYWVVFVDDIGKGFANEHRAAMLLQKQIPVPMP
jgi:hypothetical protein